MPLPTHTCLTSYDRPQFVRLGRLGPIREAIWRADSDMRPVASKVPQQLQFPEARPARADRVGHLFSQLRPRGTGWRGYCPVELAGLLSSRIGGVTVQ